ncbi:MAG: hypothetical protein HYZ51_01315, partial [Candidatus Doudnabacteria bacterium]|nr:hypothetical protein [Candidatus Doudnabacteria bacterium]
KEHGKEITVGVCFVLIFLIGFGTGRYHSEAGSASRRSEVQNNYSKTSANQQKTPSPTIDEARARTKQQVAGDTVSAAKAGDQDPKADCLIKGNISATGGKIYHIKGGAFYDRTNPEQCFNTEEEAKGAGYRRSSR